MNPGRREVSPSGGKGWILLVDDEEAVRQITGKMLSRLGYTVEYVCDGMEVLAKFSMSPDRFACVILDLATPVMNGVETFRRVLE